MHKLVKFEDNPNYLCLLKEYATAATTLSLGLLGLSITFMDKLIGTSTTGWSYGCLVLTWLALLLALVFALFIIAHLTGVSSNYVRALQVACPDVLSVVAKGDGSKVDVKEAIAEIAVPAEGDRKIMKEALDRSSKRMHKAGTSAKISLFCLGIAASSITLLGVITLLLGEHKVDANFAAKKTMDFIASQYNVAKADLQLTTLTYDTAKKMHTLQYLQTTPQVKYDVKVNSNGEFEEIKKTP